MTRRNLIIFYLLVSVSGLVSPAFAQESQLNTETRTLPEKRKQRADLGQFARPQSGVDDLKDKFGRPTEAIPGVVDSKNTSRD